MTEVWSIRKVLTWAADDLRTRGTDTPRLDAELLLAHVLGTNRIGLVVDAERPLSKAELAAYRELHKRRRTGEPVAYMLGVREFYGRPFRVDRRVLIPRPDTEILVEVAMERTSARSLSGTAVDLCTGSGCVAITLAKERPTWSVIGTDLSADALEVARENAQRLGALPHVCFAQGDLFAAVAALAPRARGRLNLVTANPPYIAEHERSELARTIIDFEPHLALFGGEDGLAITRRVVVEASEWLAPEGVLALEVGAGQAPAVAGFLRDRGYRDVESRKDYGGVERVVSGVRSAA
ncbi:MAG: peptide chain release factor N(5)-glutamine methyltransferase [Polyangiaceae bacterium]